MHPNCSDDEKSMVRTISLRHSRNRTTSCTAMVALSEEFVLWIEQ